MIYNLDLPSDNIFNFKEQLIPVLPITDALHIMPRKQRQGGVRENRIKLLRFP